MLKQKLASDVLSRVRSRGKLYAQANAVHIVGNTHEEVIAEVMGTSSYEVVLQYDRSESLVWCHCSCSYFLSRNEPCKHAWALVEICDREGLLAAAAADEDVGLEPATDGLPPRAQVGGVSRSDWRTQLSEVAVTATERLSRVQLSLQILYRINLATSRQRGVLTIELGTSKREQNGDWAKPRWQRLNVDSLDALPDPADRTLLAHVSGAVDLEGGDLYRSTFGLPKVFSISIPLETEWLRIAAGTNRLRCSGSKDLDVDEPVPWDDGDPWVVTLEFVLDRTGSAWRLEGNLTRFDERRSHWDAELLSQGGVLVLDGRLGQIEVTDALEWLLMVRRNGAFEVPVEEAAAFVETLGSLGRPEALCLPESLQFDQTIGDPHAGVVISTIEDQWRVQQISEVELVFDYDGTRVSRRDPRSALYNAALRRAILRDSRKEADAETLVRTMGVQNGPAYLHANGMPTLVISAGKVNSLVRKALAAGWWVEVDGAAYRDGTLSLDISSDIDWFDLDGDIVFDDYSVELPVLLRALHEGSDTLPLADGHVGMIPDAVRTRLEQLMQFAALEDGKLRFGKHQVGLVDALLRAQPEIRFDKTVAQARRKLEGFEKVKPRGAPRTFRGELRDYQRDGLGWLHFLRRFGLGGCLADDMGLGKTVQVLALLEWWRGQRRAASMDAPVPPSLVVVPRSLVFNWLSEARRFVPRLRICEHVGTGRARSPSELGDEDVLLTTYGTLRRDIGWLREVEFGYAILDESQAIKNPKSVTAKAARLLRARHRLALSGTPIENHLGELVSLFDFLIPGLFGGGRYKPPKRLLKGAVAVDEPAVQLIASTVRPFVLRRLKEQVALDLPAKQEDVLFCDLPKKHRKEYDQLRDHYRQILAGRIESRGLARSKMIVLEALLRLRQAACHPGLLNAHRKHEASAKLEMLLPRLEEIARTGKKALVFSQFTTMLGIIKTALDDREIDYTYLDGRTRKRQARVDSFQNDPSVSIFLVSLKAGGVGLNLTAAEYVFLFDPWWNPATEAQAIDRTHRIGQEKAVFAYRLIARDTIEEKVMLLQRSKQHLAQAVLTADTRLVSNLTKEDLALLLSE